MPLLPLYNDPDKNPNLVLNKPPLILFPGILGDKSDFQFLAAALDNSISHKGSIYGFQNGRLLSDAPPLNLSEQIDEIAQELITKASYAPYTFQLVGYSYGCTLAVLVAQRLKELGHDAHVFLVDGIAPEETRQYFATNNSNATKDLIKVFEAAAKFSNLKPVEMTEALQQRLNEKSFIQQFGELQALSLKLNQSTDPFLLKRYLTFLEVVKDNMNYSLSNSIPQYQAKLDTINYLSLKETAEKHNDVRRKWENYDGGWENYAEKINVIPVANLQKQNLHAAPLEHTKLLEESNCLILAKMIMGTFNKEINPQLIFQNALTHHLEILQRNYPDVSVRDAVQHYYNSSPSPSPSSPASSDDEEKNDVEAMEIDTSQPVSPKSLPRSPRSPSPSSEGEGSPKLFGIFSQSHKEIEQKKLAHERTSYSTRGRDRARMEKLGSYSRPGVYRA